MRALTAIAYLFLSGAPRHIADFQNIAAKAGLTRPFPNGGTTSKQYIIETTGSGIALVDYDNDGLVDIFIVSGKGGSNRLYHNDGHDHFSDVTAETGLTSEGWGQGVCAGDYNNDGFIDLFVTYWGQNRLYRNIGGKRFEDVTAAAHLTQDRVRYNTGCAFLDYDNDGHLDLFVSNYLRFDPEKTPKPGENPYCWYRGIPVNCGPRGLPFDRNILYRGNTDGTFTDISESSKIAEPVGHYSLGVLTGDFNGDGLPDIYVACDQTPSLLYINQGNGTFEEEAVLRGVAYDENGKAMSGMGVAASDYDGDGLLDIFRSNFSDERETLYRNRGKGEFDDVTTLVGLARNTRYVGWGCGFFDFDNDGWKDLLLVNGHVFPEVDTLNSNVRYKNPIILYHNNGKGAFDDISTQSGAGLQEQHASRGAAFGDIDNDGSLEVVVNNQNERPSLLKQSVPSSNHWIELKLVGTRSNRAAIGARVQLTTGGRTLIDEVRSGGSYLSQNDLRLHFGLKNSKEVDRIEVQWPAGTRQTLSHVKADRQITIAETQTKPPAIIPKAYPDRDGFLSQF
ncbi:MAG TPA: CRTAC1 family protein [Bryobacteraceae bacterium]|nr:CRTAC1 family protein [Bryobacteraceae bacterium]